MDLDSSGQQSAPQPTVPFTEPGKIFNKALLLPILVAIISLGVGFAGGFTLRGTLSLNNAVPSEPAQVPTSPGIKSAIQFNEDNPELVKKTFMQQIIEGTISTIEENGLTLEANGQTLTVNDNASVTRYSKIGKVTAGNNQPTTPTQIQRRDLQTGDLVSVSRIVDLETDQVMVAGVTVMPKDK